jgi:hypothetical protein
MRRVPVFCVLSLLSVTSAPLAAGQDHHAPQNQRGAIVIGFDQELTTHQFLLFTDGGAIDVTAKSPSDARTRPMGASHRGVADLAMDR